MNEKPGQTLNQYLSHQKVQIRRIQDRVFLSLSGNLKLLTQGYPYNLIPNQASLGKYSRWKLMSEAQKIAKIEALNPSKLKENFELDLWQWIQKIEPLIVKTQLELDGKTVEKLRNPSSELDVLFCEIFQKLTLQVQSLEDKGNAQKVRKQVNLSEYPKSFQKAQSMQRKFIAVLGEPNSGKTYQAMLQLQSARSGIYLAPLRLLALENYERLKALGVEVSMVTGEEKRITPGATHVVSTVEMLDYQTEVEIAVIDEIQMLEDPYRGSAWTAAVCGAPASTVYLIGSLSAKEAVKALAKRLDCEIEIIELKRKSALQVQPEPLTNLKQLRKGDALIAFSRKEVLGYRDLLLDLGFSVATVYGNLSPEVRQGQAALFREGKVDVLIGTDALAMGLNMPIDRVVFSTASKFNGEMDEALPAWLVQQIGGRAGRFGISEKGLVAGLGPVTHEIINQKMSEPLQPVRSKGFYVCPNMEYLKELSRITGETRLHRLLQRFIEDVEQGDSFFIPSITVEQMQRAQFLDTQHLDLEQKFAFSLMPLSTKSKVADKVFRYWISQVEQNRQSLCPKIHEAIKESTLVLCEEACKVYSAYSWMSYRMPELFPQQQRALDLAQVLGADLDELLTAMNQRRAKRRHYV